jgi:GTP-binding protein YchF
MKIGVVGLPNVGKSTLFNALTKKCAESANYPFCTIEPNVGIVAVPDARVDFLSRFYAARSTVYATIEFVDIAGLVKGASTGEGLGNKFLANIREADAIVHVVRAFDKGDIIHVEGTVDPARDIGTINLELILSDIETVTKRMEKTAKQAQTGNKEAAEELAVLKKLKEALDREQPASSVLLDDKEKLLLRGFGLLSAKPVIYCANLNEADIATGGTGNPHFQTIKNIAAGSGAGVVGVSAKIEEELSNIEDSAERTELMAVYGLDRSGLDKLIAESYRLLGLISYLTAGEPEVRAWTIVNGTRAPQAAGKIHTDFERGFIRAEVVAYDDFAAAGSMLKVREAGKLRSEGKDYVMKDGDIVHFKFNV